MANKQINQFTDKPVLSGTDSFLLQESGGTTRKTTAGAVDLHVRDAYGWTMNHDALYTQGVPLVIGNGSRVQITSNGLGGLTDVSQSPNNTGNNFFDTATDVIVPMNNVGDALRYRITMQVTPSTANVVMVLELQIEDSPVIVTGSRTFSFPNQDERQINLSTSTFVLQNFIDNNAGIYVSAIGGSLDIYDFKIFVERTYIGT